jgi:MFS family permease
MTQNDLEVYLLQVKTSNLNQTQVRNPAVIFFTKMCITFTFRASQFRIFFTQFCRWTVLTCYGVFFSIFFFLSFATFYFEKFIRTNSQDFVVILFLLFQILGSLIWGIILDLYGRYSNELLITKIFVIAEINKSI